MLKNHWDVMLSECEASAFAGPVRKADSSAPPRNDILTQSLAGEERDGGARPEADRRGAQQAPRLRHPAAFPAARKSCGLWSLLLILLACMHAWASVAFGQVSREYQLKAVFLLRLAQFTHWPADAFDSPDSPIRICVLGENPFGDALGAAVTGETAHGRPLLAQQHRAVEQIKGCHVVYLTGAGPRQAKALLSAIGGRSVLTVRDLDGLPSAYETIVGFATEQNRVVLRINVKAAAAARLELDPRLLRVAGIVNE